MPTKPLFRKGDRVYFKLLGKAGVVQDVFPYPNTIDVKFDDGNEMYVLETELDHETPPLPSGQWQRVVMSPEDTWKPAKSNYNFDEHDDKVIEEERKANGECPLCGTKLPISIHGLGECPKHPKQVSTTW